MARTARPGPTVRRRRAARVRHGVHRTAVRALPVLAVLVGLAACSDDGPRQGLPAATTTSTPASPSPSTTAEPTASTTASATASATATSPAATGTPTPTPTATRPAPGATTAPPGPPVLELRGDDLAATSVGAPFREAVAAVTRVLGAAQGDPATDVSCVSAETETTWGSFRLGGNGGAVSGWVSSSPTLQTPSGVTVGTTVTDLQRIYGARLSTFPASPDAGVTFSVQDVDLGGSLSGANPTDRVERLFNGSCSPP